MLAAHAPQALLADVEAFLWSLHHSWTRFDPTSDLARVNRDAGSWVQVPWHLEAVLRMARELSDLSGGLFDPTADVSELGYVDDFTSTSPGSVGLPRPGGGVDAWDVRSGAVHVSPGFRLDLGGLGKGFAADLARGWLTDRGATDVWVDIGGDISAGYDVSVDVVDADASPWCRWRISSGGVATSSPRSRRWSDGNGGELHHIVDPRTGWAASETFDVVSCHATSAAAAEAAAKAVLVSGDVDAAAPLGAVAAARRGPGSLVEFSTGAQRWVSPLELVPVAPLVPAGQ